MFVGTVIACLVCPALSRAQTVQERKVEALYIHTPIQLDGSLEESVWSQAAAATDFIQKEPRQGEPATEATEVRFLYDDQNLYIGALCLDSAGPSGIVVTDIRRDYSDSDNDHLGIVLDTFDDDRTGFLFATNPAGAKRDGQIGGSGSPNFDWDGIWHVRTRITPRGWEAEIAIPFRTLRFKQGDRAWGMNVVRRIRRKNEDTHWSPVPRPYRVSRTLFAGSLEGIRRISQGRNLNVTPYLSAPVLRRPRDDVDFVPEVGLDVKYGVTPGLTLDLTANTDFAQVEADEQQINLTRFSLFFPEKRDFFLENSGIFQVGRFGGRFGTSRDLIAFFSRRIGITEGQMVPILGGARLTGRLGGYTLGILSMQTDEFDQTPSTNFSVLRLTRDVFRSSEIGGIFIHKQEQDGDFNRTYGGDVNLRFFRYLDISSLLLGTGTPGLEDRDLAGDVSVSWSEPRLEAEGSYTAIGSNFNPEVGFVPRRGIRKSHASLILKPRPGERIPWIREFRPGVVVDYITNQENQLETRSLQGSFLVVLQNSSSFEGIFQSHFERLDTPFSIRTGQDIPVGDYRFREYSLAFSSDQRQLISGNVFFGSGGFFDGDKDSLELGLNLRPGFRFAAEAAWGQDRIRLPSGDFDTDLVTTRIRYAFSTRVFLNTLIQYNSTIREIATNVRFNFIYKPLSDLFLVYNERRSTTGEVSERALIAKLTYVFGF